MGPRYEIEIIILSAKGLKNVNWRHGKLKPYGVVWVDHGSKFTTRVDDEGDTKPYWDDKLIIPLDSPIEDSTLYIDIVHAESAEDTKPLIGSTKLHLRDVVDDVGLGVLTERKLDLKRPSGRPHGKVVVKMTVRDPRYRAPDPYYAPPYGVPPPGIRDYPSPSYGIHYRPSDYAAPPAGYPASYGAPPPIYGQSSYSQPAEYGRRDYYGQQGYVEDKKTNKFGGMGAGLAVGALAGALGGFALAEGVDALEDKISDDVANRVEDDLGYDGDDF